MRSILRCRAEARGADRPGGCSIHGPAIKSAFELLIRRQVGNIHHGIAAIRPIRAISAGTWHFARHHSAVIVPVETQPWSPLPRLVLHMSGGVENLIMIDTKHFAPGGQGAQWSCAN